MPVIVGCVIIAALLAAGLWLASRYARQAVSESRQQTLTLRDELTRAAREGREEALRESGELDAADVAGESDVVTSPEAEHTAWMRQVNEFIAREVLAGGGPDADDRVPTLLEALHRASRMLETAEAKPPAVEAAIRTMLASSYLSLDRLDDAAAQCMAALQALRTGFGEMHDYTCQARRNLGAVELRRGNLDEAAIVYQALYEMRLASNGPDDPRAAETLRIARLLRDQAALDPGAYSAELRDLLVQPPPCCDFKPLEF